MRSGNSGLVPAPRPSPFSIASCLHAPPWCESTSSISLTLSETFLRYVKSLEPGNKPAHVVRRHTVDYKRSMVTMRWQESRLNSFYTNWALILSFLLTLVVEASLLSNRLKGK